MVEVILLERIEKLGQIGDVVRVRPGFARNFLLPKKKALRATKANLAVFEARKAQLLADNLKRREEAEQVLTKMAGLGVTMVRQSGESGQLFGSVTSRDIADAVTAKGFTIDRAQVSLDKPIKTTGVTVVTVVLHPEVTAKVKVAVAPSQDEADARLRGEAILSADAQAAAEDAAEAEAAAAA
jgi:large subunit ribosomal protein L9